MSRDNYRWWRSAKANEAAAARERLANRLREAARLDNELNWAISMPGDGRHIIIPGGRGWREKVILSETFTEPSRSKQEITPAAGEPELEAGP